MSKKENYGVILFYGNLTPLVKYQTQINTKPNKIDRLEEKDYRKKVISLLESIKSNTDNLDILVKLTHESNDKQDEIIEIAKELHEITKCADKEQAKTKYRKVMDKIHSLNTDIDTVVKLTGYATTFYTVLHSAGII